MKRLSSLEIRHTFLDFFKDRHKHVIVPTSSVIPSTNQGTYFTNSGMCQFLPVFLGQKDPERLYDSRRLASCQRCIRVGGKHNDLDEVGKDEYHHTFFEMLGNWSFGSYSKADACSMALNLLEGGYGVPRSRLYFTYFGGNANVPADEETKRIWRDLGVDEARILPFERDNFWSMDECGPCGPSTEIHFDKTADLLSAAAAAGTASVDSRQLVNAGDEKVVEIWNLVFMQYDRVRTNDGYELIPLNTTHVDTGLGLERLAAILQRKRSNYETDAFSSIIEQLERHSGMRFRPSPASPSTSKGGQPATVSEQHHVNEAMRIVADHARMWTVAFADGLRPGSANLEKKLRVVLNRAFRAATHTLHVDGPALRASTECAIETLGAFYADLVRARSSILSALDDAYARFRRHDEATRTASKHLVGVEVGRPETDKIRTVAGKNVGKTAQGTADTVDHEVAAFRIDEDTLRQLSTALRSAKVQRTNDVFKYEYNADLCVAPLHSTVVALVEQVDGRVHVRNLHQDTRVDADATLGAIQLERGVSAKKYGLLLDRSPFYVHNEGGQRGDRGHIMLRRGADLRFVVTHVARCNDEHVVHWGYFDMAAAESLAIKTPADLQAISVVDATTRAACARAHSATHLLIAALQRALNGVGESKRNVRQRGSRVDEDRLVLEFVVESNVHSSEDSTRAETVTLGELEQAERLVSDWLGKSLTLARSEHELDEALTRFPNVRRIPEERYPQRVTVVRFADPAASTDEPVSAELCCGTHVHASASIGAFVIVSARKLEARAAKSVVALVGEPARVAIANSETLVTRMREVQRGVEALRKRLATTNLKRVVTQHDSLARRSSGDAGSQPRDVTRQLDEKSTRELGALEAQLNEVIALLGTPWFVTRKTVRDAVRKDTLTVRSRISKLKHKHSLFASPNA